MFDVVGFLELLSAYGQNMDEHIRMTDEMFDKVFDPEDGLVRNPGDEIKLDFNEDSQR